MSKKTYLFSTSSHPDAISINSLDITLLKPEIDFSKYDYFILTSKQACNALDQYEKRFLKPALCISKATAQAYENIEGDVLQVGAGYGDNLGDALKKYQKKTNWLYIRAKEIASDFAKRSRDDGYNVDEVVLYESCCSKDIKNVELDDDATLIFTSPSSVICFLASHTMSPKNKVIVIGKTTAKALPKGIEYKLSKETTIQSCLELI